MIGRWLARQLRWPTVRAIRGATTVPGDTPEQIATAVLELLEAMRARNQFHDHEVISVIFTMTPDLQSAFPAEAARRAGWHDIPLLCSAEVAVPGGLPRCLRVLMHVERSWVAGPVPVYLHEAVRLRPDLVGAGSGRDCIPSPVATTSTLVQDRPMT